MLFVPVNIVNTIERLTRSAMPDAPQVPEPEPRRSVVRASIGRVLRAVADHEVRLADRLDPRSEPSA